MSSNIEDAVELAVKATVDSNRRAYVEALAVFAQSDPVEVIEALGNAIYAAADGNADAEINQSTLLPDVEDSRRFLRAIIELDTKVLNERLGDNYIEFEVDLISLAAALRQGGQPPIDQSHNLAS